MNLSKAEGTDANQQQLPQPSPSPPQQPPQEQPPAPQEQQQQQAPSRSDEAQRRLAKFTQFHQSLKETMQLADQICEEAQDFENDVRRLNLPGFDVPNVIRSLFLSAIYGLPAYLTDTLQNVKSIQKFYSMTLHLGIFEILRPTSPLALIKDATESASGSNGDIVEHVDRQPAGETQEEIIDPGSNNPGLYLTNRGTVAEEQQVEVQQQPNQELAAQQLHPYANAFGQQQLVGAQAEYQQLNPLDFYRHYSYFYFNLQHFNAVREGKIVIQPKDVKEIFLLVEKGLKSKPLADSSGKKPATLLLPFLLNLLLNEEMSELIQFTGRRYEFIIKNTEGMAKLWGQQKIDKNGGNMNYDKFSRAIRYYYDKQPGIIKAADSQP